MDILYLLARWVLVATITGSVLVGLILLAKWAVGNRPSRPCPPAR